MHDFLSGRKIRTPHRYQFQTTECGVAALGIILAHYGRMVPMEDIRRATGVSRDCLNAVDIMAGARAFGLEPKVRRCEPETLERLGFPMIVHLHFIHFAVVEGMTPTHVLLNDPHAGRQDISRDRFDEAFTGIALTFTPTEGFRRDPGLGEHDPAVGSLLRPCLWGLAGALSGQILSALALVWLAHQLFQGAFALVAASLFCAGLTARTVLLARIRGRLEDDLSRRLLDHILRLNSETLTYRMHDRLAGVVAAPRTIAAALLGRLAPCWLNLVSVPVLLGGVALFAPLAAGVLAVLTGLICLCYLVVLPWQGDRRMPFPVSGEDPADALAETIAQPRQWTFAGGDRAFVTSAMGKLAGNQQLRLDRHAGDTANALLGALAVPLFAGAVILWTLSGPDRATMLQVLFLALAIALPLGWVPRVRGQWRIANRLLADVRDVLAAPVAGPDLRPPPDPDRKHPNPVAPVLIAQGVTHGFSRTRRASLGEIDLVLHAGEQLCITGPSGGGKSTLGRVLAGLSTPWSGAVTYLGQPVTRGHGPAWIDGRGVFFHATLRENLALWDGTVTDDAILAALEIACIAPEVAGRPQGLDTVLDPRLAPFSGGQMQRFEIARAVLREPQAIILDEALDALNPDLESQIRARLRQQGISLIVISHRHSTLAACDRVLTVRKGRIVDRPDDAAPARHDRAPMDRDPPAAAPPPAGLQDAFNAVTRQMGLDRSARGATLPQLAASANVLFRRQRFRAADWRFEPAHSILLDGPGGAAALSATGKPHPPAARDGVLLYDADAPQTTDPWPIVRAALWRARRDLVRMVLPGIGGAAALFLLPPALVQAPHSVITAGLALMLLLLGIALMQIACRVAAVRMSFTVERHMLLQLLLQCRRMQTGALERLSFPGLVNAVRVPGTVAAALRCDAPRAVHALTLCLFGVAYVAVAHVPALAGLGLACALAAGLPAIAARGLRQRARHYRDERRHIARLTAHLMSGLPRLQTLRALGTVSDHWRRQKDAHARTALALRCRSGLVRVMPWGLAVVGLAATGLPTQPDLALAGLLALAAAATLGQLGVGLVAACPRLNDMRRLLHVPRATGTARAGATDTIEIRHLTHGFDGKAVLENVSTRLVPGSITVLAGASGSGKSTLLDLVLGVMPPVAGDICHGETSIRDLDAMTRNRRIGAVFQHDHLEDATTVRAHVSVTDLVDVARAWELLEQVALAEDVAAMPMGLQTIVDTNALSTGQMQRLLIARQLAGDPDLLVLDEALSAVPDDVAVRLVANFRKAGLTCLIVTHRESTIRLADTVIVMADGRVVHEGCPDAALARSEFRRARSEDRDAVLS